MKLTLKLLLIAFVALPFILSIADGGRTLFANAEDATEEDEIEVEADIPAPDIPAADPTPETVPDEDSTDDEEADKKKQGSPDVELTMLFTKPVGDGSEIPAGKAVEFVIGVANSGDHDFIIDGVDASLRYPTDYNYHIQNFTAALYAITVKPKQEASIMYSFAPAEVFAGRPLGLTINLGYHDADGQDFIEAVFNSTVNITDVDEGFDTETLFMYIFLLAFIGLLGYLAYQAFETYVGIPTAMKSSAAKASTSSAKPSVEMGSAKEGVDYEWLPEHLQSQLKKKVSNEGKRTSPRLRKP